MSKKQKTRDESRTAPAVGLSGLLCRLPIIRHIRYYYYSFCIMKWARFWAKHGIGLGYPHPQDQKFLEDIWNGER